MTENEKIKRVKDLIRQVAERSTAEALTQITDDSARKSLEAAHMTSEEVSARSMRAIIGGLGQIMQQTQDRPPLPMSALLGIVEGFRLALIEKGVGSGAFDEEWIATMDAHGGS